VHLPIKSLSVFRRELDRCPAGRAARACVICGKLSAIVDARRRVTPTTPNMDLSATFRHLLAGPRNKKNRILVRKSGLSGSGLATTAQKRELANDINCRLRLGLGLASSAKYGFIGSVRGRYRPHQVITGTTQRAGLGDRCLPRDAYSGPILIDRFRDRPPTAVP